MKASTALLLGLAALATGGAMIAMLGGGGGSGGTGKGTGGTGGSTPIPGPPPTDEELKTNWGKTPMAWRPFFIAMERIADVPGSARLFAILAWRRAKFNPSAVFTSVADRIDCEQIFVRTSPKRPPLRYAVDARRFGFGGLFAMSVPDFLWSGYKEVWAKAPLLKMLPDNIKSPQLSAFAIIMRLHELQSEMRPADMRNDYFVAMVDPYVFTEMKGTPSYQTVLANFKEAADELGIDTAPFPARFESGTAWKGVPAVYVQMLQIPAPAKDGVGGKIAA